MMKRKGLMPSLCAALVAMLSLPPAWALSVEGIAIDPAGSLGFTLGNDDGVTYDGIIIETPFTAAEQFQLGGDLPAGWSQTSDLGAGVVRSLYIAVPGPGMAAGETLLFPVLFDNTLIPDLSDFLKVNGGTFTITAFTLAGAEFSQSYSLGPAAVPLPMSWILLMSGLGMLLLVAGKYPQSSTGAAPGKVAGG